MRNIVKRLYLIFILVVSFIFLGCASSKIDDVSEKKTIEEKEPKWISDKGRLELFPDSDFISQLAYGNSAEQAKLKAASNIAEYIKSSVVSSVTSNYFYKENETQFSEEISLSENIEITTKNDLFKIEYTNPFYYEDLGQYVCVAFINRNEAFNFVKQKLEIGRREFPLTYSKAMSNESLMDKIIGIEKAQEFLKGFYEVYDFARAINPEKCKIYEEIDLLANDSIVNLKELSSDVLIKIEGVGDIDLLNQSGVITELENQFSTLGFVVGNSVKFNCIALVEVRSSIKSTSTTYETYPELNIRIIEKGVEKISYSKQLAKVAGFDKDTVIRRTNLALIKEIKTTFLDECF